MEKIDYKKISTKDLLHLRNHLINIDLGHSPIPKSKGFIKHLESASKEFIRRQQKALKKARALSDYNPYITKLRF